MRGLNSPGMAAPGLFDQARGLTREQRNAFLAAWLGWAMDAFSFFLVVFVLSDDREGVRAVHDDGRVPHHGHADRPADRGARVRDLGGQEGPPHPADGRRPLLLRDRGALRPRAHLHRPDRAALPVRPGHGRRVGPRRLAGAREDPGGEARVLRPACCSRATRWATCSPTLANFAITPALGWRWLFVHRRDPGADRLPHPDPRRGVRGLGAHAGEGRAHPGRPGEDLPAAEGADAGSSTSSCS